MWAGTRSRGKFSWYEVLLTHAKPRLVRLTPFRMGSRPERQTGRVCDKILAVLSELVDERREFTMRELAARLNPGHDERRGRAVEKAVQRLAHHRGDETPSVVSLRAGKYRLGLVSGG